MGEVGLPGALREVRRTSDGVQDTRVASHDAHAVARLCDSQVEHGCVERRI